MRPQGGKLGRGPGASARRDQQRGTGRSWNLSQGESPRGLTEKKPNVPL